MADPPTRPAGVPVDRLAVVREWLWRHSSQPNGDPWDGDPEHLNRAAQHLLNDLLSRLLGADSSVPTRPFARLTRTPDSAGIAVTPPRRLLPSR